MSIYEQFEEINTAGGGCAEENNDVTRVAVQTACVCKIKPPPKRNGSIYKTPTFENKRTHKKGNGQRMPSCYYRN